MSSFRSIKIGILDIYYYIRLNIPQFSIGLSKTLISFANSFLRTYILSTQSNDTSNTCRLEEGIKNYLYVSN